MIFGIEELLIYNLTMYNVQLMYNLVILSNLQFDDLQFTIYLQSYLIYDLTIYDLLFMYYFII